LSEIKIGFSPNTGARMKVNFLHHFTAFSQRGRGKLHNEDALLVAGHVKQGSVREEGLVDASIPVLFAVADGVAISNRPRTASRILLDMLSNRFAKENKQVEHMLHALQVDFMELGAKDPKYFGMATTLAGVRIERTDVTVFNVGDSRVYVLDKDGGIHQLTRDQTLLQDMLDNGEITAEEASHAASIYQGLTGQFIADSSFDEFRFNITHHTLQAGEKLLLASDGLYEALTDDEVAMLIGNGSSQCLQDTFTASRKHGGTDDFSLICILAD
jgi:serine/threonine protein phosphatase PrpC